MSSEATEANMFFGFKFLLCHTILQWFVWLPSFSSISVEAQEGRSPVSFPWHCTSWVWCLLKDSVCTIWRKQKEESVAPCALLKSWFSCCSLSQLEAFEDIGYFSLTQYRNLDLIYDQLLMILLSLIMKYLHFSLITDPKYTMSIKSICKVFSTGAEKMA